MRFCASGENCVSVNEIVVEEIEICFYDLLIVLHYRFVLSFLLITDMYCLRPI